MRFLAPRFRCALARPALAAGAALLACAAATGSDIQRPDAARRVVKVFDFEEKPLNPEPVPMHWVRAQHDPPDRIRPGFPFWNKAAFDNSFHTSGEWSVKLPTQGGSTSLRLSSGVIAAIPGADYHVSANVRTDGLIAARARVVTRFLDEQRAPIGASERSSELAQTGGEWAKVSLTLPGDFANAAWIQIDLELLQPRRQPGANGATPEDANADPVDRQRALLEDVAGAAWFDDVQVDQTPRIELALRAEGGVAIGPATPEFSALIRDLTGERLRGRITITDVDDAPLASVDFDAPGGRERYLWRPALSQYGWGRATLEVFNDSGRIASATREFAWTPPAPAHDARARNHGAHGSAFAESDRFGLIVEDLEPERLGYLPAMIRATGAGLVQLSAWDAGLTKDQARPKAEAIEKLIERVGAADAGVTLTLSHIPRELGKSIGVDPDASPLAALSAPGANGDEPAWREYLADALSKFGQRVRRWQVGRTGESLAFWRPSLAAEASSVEVAFAKLVPKPVVALPWSPEQGLDDRVPRERALTLVIPWQTPPEIVPELVERLGARDRADADNAVVLQTPPDSMFGPRGVAEDLVKRAVLAWSMNPRRLAIERPWDVAPGAPEDALPRATLPVWRQIVERLGGRRVAGELLVTQGARCLILDGPRGGALVGWTDWADPADAMVEMYLGAGAVTVVDPFGNEEPVAVSNGQHRLGLGPTPVFVEGINVELARFRAGFTVDPPSLPAEAALQSAELILQNPWPIAISGTLRVLEPARWKIEPRVMNFDIPAGGTQRLACDLSFGVSEESGVKRVVAEADVSADNRYSRVRLSAPLDIGLTNISLTPSYAFVADESGVTNDVSITLSVTNNADQPSSLRVFALAPGYPRLEATVSALAPGQSAVRRFLLPKGVSRVMNQRVRVGLVQVGGSERLNKTMVIQ